MKTSWSGQTFTGEVIVPLCTPPQEYLVLDLSDNVLDGGSCAGTNEIDGSNSIILSDPPYSPLSTYKIQVWDSGSYETMISENIFKVYNPGILSANTRSITPTLLSSSITNTIDTLWPLFLPILGIPLAFFVARKIAGFFGLKNGK